jgi:hypothetical protein
MKLFALNANVANTWPKVKPSLSTSQDVTLIRLLEAIRVVQAMMCVQLAECSLHTDSERLGRAST